jgi:hypothetical protein
MAQERQPSRVPFWRRKLNVRDLQPPSPLSSPKSVSQVGGLKLRSIIQDQLARIGPLENLVGKSIAAVRSAVAGVQMEIVNPRLAADGSVQFTVTGILPSGAVRAEYSDDLQTWTPLNSPALTALPAAVTDAQPRSTRERFYRVSVIPGAP